MSEELARRAVACKRWRWMPGMVAIWPHGVGAFRVNADGGAGDMRTFPGALPDLTDPATLGCLLALVREAWGDLCAHVWYSAQTGGWVWVAHGAESQVHGRELNYHTEAEALVAALEAAP